jgi:outer membrane receptor for ferric coprogen and ferric-rhodotorulic acid
MRRALNINLLPSALALAVSLPVAGYVQAQEIEFNIPAQALGSALQEFGRQANVQVLYSPTDVAGKRALRSRASWSHSRLSTPCWPAPRPPIA